MREAETQEVGAARGSGTGNDDNEFGGEMRILEGDSLNRRSGGRDNVDASRHVTVLAPVTRCAETWLLSVLTVSLVLLLPTFSSPRSSSSPLPSYYMNLPELRCLWRALESLKKYRKGRGLSPKDEQVRRNHGVQQLSPALPPSPGCDPRPPSNAAVIRCRAPPTALAASPAAIVCKWLAVLCWKGPSR